MSLQFLVACKKKRNKINHKASTLRAKIFELIYSFFSRRHRTKRLFRTQRFDAELSAKAIFQLINKNVNFSKCLIKDKKVQQIYLIIPSEFILSIVTTDGLKKYY